MEMDTTCSDIDQQPIETISHEFTRQLYLKSDDDDDSTSTTLPDPAVPADEEEEEEEEEEDFTFMLVGGEIEGDKVLGDGAPVFPLFDQKLLLGDYEVEELIDHRGLPIQPPVDKIFIQSPPAFDSDHDEEEDANATTGPWSKEEIISTAKKSNSTGFSKLWRLKEKGGRSNSYGRDAFVFFKTSADHNKTTATASSSSSSSKPVAVGKARLVKGKKSNVVSAHEAYLKKSRAEEERRRSYLPYRPELMGFFTNVHGGHLTKNVHPY